MANAAALPSPTPHPSRRSAVPPLGDHILSFSFSVLWLELGLGVSRQGVEAAPGAAAPAAPASGDAEEAASRDAEAAALPLPKTVDLNGTHHRRRPASQIFPLRPYKVEAQTGACLHPRGSPAAAGAPHHSCSSRRRLAYVAPPATAQSCSALVEMRKLQATLLTGNHGGSTVLATQLVRVVH
jgi:hypothetical protein